MKILQCPDNETVRRGTPHQSATEIRQDNAAQQDVYHWRKRIILSISNNQYQMIEKQLRFLAVIKDSPQSAGFKEISQSLFNEPVKCLKDVPQCVRYQSYGLETSGSTMLQPKTLECTKLLINKSSMRSSIRSKQKVREKEEEDCTFVSLMSTKSITTPQTLFEHYQGEYISCQYQLQLAQIAHDFHEFCVPTSNAPQQQVPIPPEPFENDSDETVTLTKDVESKLLKQSQEENESQRTIHPDEPIRLDLKSLMEVKRQTQYRSYRSSPSPSVSLRSEDSDEAQDTTTSDVLHLPLLSATLIGSLGILASKGLLGNRGRIISAGASALLGIATFIKLRAAQDLQDSEDE